MDSENNVTLTQRLFTWRKKLIVLAILVVSVVITLAVVLPVVLVKRGSEIDALPSCSGRYGDWNYSSAFSKFKKASVAVDSPFCSRIGKQILLENGSAVDAAIAAGICNGISDPFSMGIGGGDNILIYLREKKKVIAIDARETAPLKAYETMFVNNSMLSYIGGLATAIPGEIAGFWQAHQIAGKLPWKSLFQPTVDLCRKGIEVSPVLEWVIDECEDDIRQDPELLQMFINPLTKKPYKYKETIKYLKFADTLEKIGENGAKIFYDGELSKVIVRENNLKGGILTLDDLKNYRPANRTPIEVKLNDGYKLYGLPPPSSSVLVSFIVNVMSKFKLNKETFKTTESKVLFYHRLMETFKHTYAKRSFLGDSDFVNVTDLVKNLTSNDYVEQIFGKIKDDKTFTESYYEPAWFNKNDHGTAHISVLAENGDAVSMTCTINTYFGAMYAGEETGIIYNNEMDDFSTPGTVNYYGVPASQANFIRPGKRPMSSMSPIIVVDENDDVRLVLGASGGTHIITSVAAVALKNLFIGQTLKEAIDEPRLHHQLFPNWIGFESDIPEELFPQQDLIKGLIAKNHTVKCFELGYSVVVGVDRNSDGEITACSDHRKNGDVDGY